MLSQEFRSFIMTQISPKVQTIDMVLIVQFCRSGAKGLLFRGGVGGMLCSLTPLGCTASVELVHPRAAKVRPCSGVRDISTHSCFLLRLRCACMCWSAGGRTFHGCLLHCMLVKLQQELQLFLAPGQRHVCECFAEIFFREVGGL